jgi:hypothetical protein
MKITATNYGLWKEFIYCTDDRFLKPTFVLFMTRKNSNPPAELIKNYTFFLSGKSQTELDV